MVVIIWFKTGGDSSCGRLPRLLEARVMRTDYSLKAGEIICVHSRSQKASSDSERRDAWNMLLKTVYAGCEDNDSPILIFPYLAHKKQFYSFWQKSEFRHFNTAYDITLKSLFTPKATESKAPDNCIRKMLAIAQAHGLTQLAKNGYVSKNKMIAPKKIPSAYSAQPKKELLKQALLPACERCGLHGEFRGDIIYITTIAGEWFFNYCARKIQLYHKNYLDKPSSLGQGFGDYHLQEKELKTPLQVIRYIKQHDNYMIKRTLRAIEIETAESCSGLTIYPNLMLA